MKQTLTKAEWEEVRIQFCNGMPIGDIAKHFDISYHSIYRKSQRKKWIVEKEFISDSKVVSLSEFKKNKRVQSILLKQFKYRELNEAINFVIESFSRGLESRMYELLKQRYPEKRISFYMVDKLKQFARKRIRKLLDTKAETLVHEYIIRMDLLYNMALKDHDYKTACYITEQKGKVLGLHNPKDNSDYDIDADIEKRIKEFDELNQRLEKDITPPLLSDIM